MKDFFKSNYTLLAVFVLVVFSSFFYFKSPKQDIDYFFLKEGPVVAFGDSLTYGSGSSPGKRYTDFLSKHLNEKVINKGFPGITSLGALNKLDEVLDLKPKMVIITLGGNDVIKKIPRKESLKALTDMFDAFLSENIRVIFLGLNPPLHFGAKKLFKEIRQVCVEKEILFVDSLMDGLWGKTEYMADAIHPNQKGQKEIALRVFNSIKSYFSKP